jgi:glycosyltransferase involved in cell wall biosynthesis
MKHVIILTFSFRPNLDGVAESSYALAYGLAERGYEVVVATAYHSNRAEEMLKGNPRVVQFKISGTSNFRHGIQGEVEGFRNFLKSSQVDILICQQYGTWPTDLALSVLKQIPSKKILISHGFGLHEIPWHPKFPWGLWEWAGWIPMVMKFPMMLRRFDQAVFLSSRSDGKRFLDRRMAGWSGYSKCAVIPNGSYPEKIEKAPDSFRDRYKIEKKLMILCVANYHLCKNQKMALTAFRKSKLNDAALVFVGSEFNEQSAELVDMDERLKVDFPDGEVIFLEKLSREMVYAAFRTADVIVLSSKSETQPLVLLEAMAAGKPFVSTDVGCIADLPGGFAVKSEEEMIEKIKELASNNEARISLGQKGRESCQKIYRWDKVLDKYEELFSK